MKKYLIPEDVQEKIIDYWRVSKLNSAPLIARNFNLSEYLVNKTINNYLSSKIKK